MISLIEEILLGEDFCMYLSLLFPNHSA